MITVQYRNLIFTDVALILPCQHAGSGEAMGQSLEERGRGRLDQ